MSKIIAIANQKGGVGKTTSTIAIGAGLVRMNKKVLLIDFDSQGNLTKALGNNHPDKIENTIANLMQSEMLDNVSQINSYIQSHVEGMDYIPSNNNLAGIELSLVNATSREKVLSRILNKVKQKYDFILIDCMPSLGILNVNALTASNKVIIPVQAEFLSTDGLNQLLKSIMSVKKKLNTKLKVEGILITMTNNRTILSKTIETKIHEEFGKNFPVYKYSIPRAVKVAESTVFGKSAIEYDPKGNASLAYLDVVKEVIAHDEKQIARNENRNVR